MKHHHTFLFGLTSAALLSGCSAPSAVVMKTAVADRAAPTAAAAPMVLAETAPMNKAVSYESGASARKFRGEAGRQMAYTASLTLNVDDTGAALAQSQEIVRKSGGYTQDVSNYRVVLRIPAAKAETAVDQIEKLGTVLSRRITGEDLTEQVSDLGIRLDNLQKLRLRLAELLKRSAKVEELLKVEQELARVTTEIEQLQARLKQAENRIRFEFPQPVTLNGLALYGTYERNATLVNTPGAIRVLADGREVLRRDDLDAGFNRRHLRTSLNWSPATARVWELVFPWRAAPAGLRRVKLQLGEIELFGPTPEVTAQNLELKLRLIRFGKPALELGSLRLSVPPGGEVRHEFACRLPELNGEAPDFGRLEAVTADGRVLAELPLLLVSDREGSCLRSRTSIQPPGQSWRIDHIVTRGFRNWLPLGSGSRDTPAGGWSTPEDIVFAYARRIKQTGSGTATDPAKLFLSEHSFTHYGNPWGSFPNGQLFFEAAAPRFLDRVRNLSAWQNAKLIVLGFGDRWDTGPSLNSMYSWQELVEFDRFRRQQGLDGLRGRTRAELIADLNKRLLHPFHAWQLDRYLRSFRAIRETIEGTGRRFGINAQGIPLLPPEAAAEIGSRLRGMSDDDTWGGLEEDFPLTAGRQMIHLAFNPGWQLVSNLVWGWDNTCLNNPHWFMPVGTTESSRRHQVTRAWRGVVGDRGDYHSIHTFGYSMNGYNSPLATVNDWQQNWNAAERQTRILPDGPLGFGLVVGTAVLSDPERAVFSGGGMGDSRLADTLIGRLFRVIGELHRRRISLPFAANATALMKFPGRSPLILPMPSTLSTEERKFLVERSRRGDALVLITDGETPAPEFQPLFADARPLPGEPRFRVGSAGIVADFRLEQLDGRAYDQLAALIREHLSPELIYPGGTAGYGFTSRGRKFITVEDLREEIDSANRIALPESFRSKKHLEREVTVVGNTDHLEIWDRETWNQMQTEAEDELMDLFFS